MDKETEEFYQAIRKRFEDRCKLSCWFGWTEILLLTGLLVIIILLATLSER